MNVGPTPERPYVCEHCHQAFSRNHNLKSHYFVHSGERPFKCETCQQAFTRHHDLKRHIRSIHTGLKPYQCPNCKRAFARLDALNRHLKVSGNAPCVGMNNPRKNYSKHKKNNEAKNKNNTKGKTETTDVKDNKIENEGTNTTNENNSNSNAYVSTAQDVTLTVDKTNPTVNLETSQKPVNNTVFSNSVNMDVANKSSNTDLSINKNNSIAEPNGVNKNHVVHAPKKSLLPPKSLKPPPRRNPKRVRPEVNGIENSDIVSTVIVTSNKSNSSTLQFMTEDSQKDNPISNEPDNVPEANTKKRKTIKTNSKTDLDSDIIDLGLDITDSSQFTIPVSENVQPFTVDIAAKLSSYTNNSQDANSTTESTIPVAQTTTSNDNNTNNQNSNSLPSNAKTIQAILDRNEYLENQLKDFKNEFYNFKKVQERLEQMESKIKELEREKGVLKDMLNEKDKQQINMQNTIFNSTSSPIRTTTTSNNNDNNSSNTAVSNVNTINNISSITTEVSSIDNVSNINTINNINGINSMNNVNLIPSDRNYNNPSNANLSYLATTTIVSPTPGKNYNTYNKGYNTYKENGNHYNTTTATAAFNSLTPPSSNNVTSFIPPQIIENSSQTSYTSNMINSDKSMSNQ